MEGCLDAASLSRSTTVDKPGTGLIRTENGGLMYSIINAELDGSIAGWARYPHHVLGLVVMSLHFIHPRLS